MSVSQICPDDLLLEARHGVLNVQDEARLAFHLSRCPRCQAALEVGRAFDGALGARPGDDAIATRIAAQLTDRPKRRLGSYALAAGMLLFGSVAVAAVGSRVWQQVFPSQSVRPVPSVVVPAEVESQRPARATPHSAVQLPEPVVSAPESQTAAPSTLRPAARSTPAPAHNVTAASLFTEANAQRSKGDSQAARKLYQELQARFAGSTEAKVSWVSLGRIELGAAPAQALRHFDAYLAQSQHTTLAEEALFGRANALQRLGRSAQERTTWRQLVERFPASVYAERARARLAATP